MKMRSIIYSLFLPLTLVGFGSTPPQQPTKKAASPKSSELLHEGDILFQVNQGGQSEAIALATGSKWTHVGILLKDKGEWMVYEAIGPVKATPLKIWASHGVEGHYTAKRWTDAETRLDAAAIAHLRASIKPYMGLPYDWEFRWSDDMIYCSELVWKVFKEGIDVELCQPKPMRDHALGSETVQEILKMRYGTTPPLDELMIAPGALYDCALLKMVGEF